MKVNFLPYYIYLASRCQFKTFDKKLLITFNAVLSILNSAPFFQREIIISEDEGKKGKICDLSKKKVSKNFYIIEYKEKRFYNIEANSAAFCPIQ